MRFRVTHLLAAVGIVALLATALANPYPYWRTILPIGTWLIYTTLACRAASCRQGREVILGALIFGLSYLGLALLSERESPMGARESTLPTGKLLRAASKLLDMTHEEIHVAAPGELTPGGIRQVSHWDSFVDVGHFVFSFIFAAIGGALAAYWSRSQSQGTKGKAQ
jgi:hypothetical protein